MKMAKVLVGCAGEIVMGWSSLCSKQVSWEVCYNSKHYLLISYAISGKKS
jgi:hypothetical protein